MERVENKITQIFEKILNIFLVEFSISKVDEFSLSVAHI